MSDDGADQGIMPERALKPVLGGKEQPTESEMMSPEEFEDKIREAPIEETDYNGAAFACARMILEAIEQYPELRGVPYEAEYLRGGDGLMVTTPNGGGVLVRAGLFDVLKQLHPEATPEQQVLLGLSGFMWGWACNAVQRILGEPPVPNPAIVEIG